jgi:tetratricopeptide (TPR) repeat protein
VDGDNQRLIELRRRVQADPASMAFAQLAEELRRAGDNDEAIGIARAGLQHHPTYLSARVTLGRALIEAGRLDEAHTELEIVLRTVPENLAANRAMAEVFQKRGQLPEALAQYKKALDLARFDPDIEQEVQRIERVVAPPAPPPPPTAPKAPTAVEDLFDFDTLLEQLGGRTQAHPTPPAAAAPPATAVPSLLESVEVHEDAGDPFSVLEQQLRVSDLASASAQAVALQTTMPPDPIARSRELQVLGELEDWLAAIVDDRDNHQRA